MLNQKINDFYTVKLPYNEVAWETKTIRNIIEFVK